MILQLNHSSMMSNDKSIETATGSLHPSPSIPMNSGREDEEGATENIKAKNKEAILTGGMGYGRKKQKALGIFWSKVWPELEKIGWKRIVGEGEAEGSMQFLPPGIDVARWGKRNIEFYDRIRLVLDRLEERTTEEEGIIYDMYCEEEKQIERTNNGTGSVLSTRSRRSQRRPRLSVSRSILTEETEIDTSWKEGRSLYPKRSSQIGADYQVSYLPEAGTYKSQNTVDKPEYDQIWDWKEATEKGMVNFIEEKVPYERKEKALELVHQSHYSVPDPDNFVQQIEQPGISGWTMKDREKFRLEIFRTRKDFKALSDILGNKSMGDVIAYYLGHYKKSDEYRLLKTARIEEREEKARQAVHDVDQCAICRQGGSLLICDGCESEWHIHCSRPPLKKIPEGRWECDVCVDRKFLDSRKRILEVMDTNLKDDRLRKRMKNELPVGSDLTPTFSSASALDRVKRFAENIHFILSETSADVELEDDKP